MSEAERLAVMVTLGPKEPTFRPRGFMCQNTVVNLEDENHYNFCKAKDNIISILKSLYSIITEIV